MFDDVCLFCGHLGAEWVLKVEELSLMPTDELILHAHIQVC